MSFLFFFLCTYIASISIAAPFTAPLLRRQDADPDAPSVDYIPPAINATVIDHAGNDITSSFNIMVFHDRPAPPPINLTTNDTVPTSKNSSSSTILGRRSYLSRQIMYCPTPRSTFISSECTPSENTKGSLQAYELTCHRTQEIFHPYTGKFLYSQSTPVRRNGHCWANEICINSVGSNSELLDRFGVKYANCVNRALFYSSKALLGLKLDKDSLLQSLEGKRLSMVASKIDERTPLQVDTFGVVSRGVSGKGGGIDKCRDCMELETEQFRKGTESLRAEARMLTTGAVAGVLWLALMSG